ncbi:hypothetical protein F5Y07DRAFT_368388 [Xylaria sp. FL0933]|nr:hypothetical protein F5Y07DRAFT_368388 [Xylaria sp. FL0933]
MQFSTVILAALSMGSAIAGPVTGYAAFNNAATAVANVNVVVQHEAANIKAATSGAHNADTVAKVHRSLLNIGQNMNGLLAPVLALNTVGPNSLSKEQIAAVPKFQKDFQAVLVNLELIGKTVTSSNLDKNALAQVKPELQWVLASPGPIARSIIVFVGAAAPKYATYYESWTPYLLNIQALIVVVLGPLALGLGLDINIL